MSIGIWQIIILAIVIGVLLGSGYLGIYIAKQNPKFKKFLTTKNVIIISLVYIVAVSFILSILFNTFLISTITTTTVFVSFLTFPVSPCQCLCIMS